MKPDYLGVVNPVYIIPYFLLVYVFGARSGGSDYNMYATDTAVAVTEDYNDHTGYMYYASAGNKEWVMTIKQTPAGNPYLIFTLNGESWQGLLKGGDSLSSGNEFQAEYRGLVRYGTRIMNVEISIHEAGCGDGTAPATTHQVLIRAAGKSYSGCCRQGAN